MSYDNYFNHLDSLGKDKNKSIQINCCNDHSNFLIDDGIIICRKCKNIINNILDSPEWKYYTSDNNNPTLKVNA